MLEQLLAEIRASGVLQASVLAGRLGTSTAMVEAMIESLERLGKLRPVQTSCGDSCGGCPLANGCVSAGQRGRLWAAPPDPPAGL